MRRPLPWVSWWFSAILVIALIALAGTLIYAQTTSASTLHLTIIDAESGDPVPDVSVEVGDLVYRTDEHGELVLPSSARAQPLHIHCEGFETWYSDIGIMSLGKKTISLNSAQQDVPAESPPPIEAMESPTPSPSPTATMTVTVLPTSTTVVATPPVSTPVVRDTATPPVVSSPVSGATLSRIEGRILDASGEGIQGGRVVAAGQVAVTGKDGVFSLNLTDVDEDSVAVRAVAPGYLEQVIDVDAGSAPLDITMQDHSIKAIYLNPNITNTDEDVDRLVEMIDTTELNAVVIDIKEELIFYDSQVPFFVDAGTVQPLYDLEALLQKFQDRNIYTIARLVVFKDSLVAEARPDLAVMNNQTGDVWRDMNGVAWVNPADHTLWEANTDLAREAAERGFDEIQFDYVRFPTDGDLSTMDFGVDYTQEMRQRAIEKFLQMADEKVYPTGAKLSADVFGYTMLVDDDLGIGQNFINVAQYVDYLSPMIYPSHFPDNSIDVPGHPNDYPYETIDISLSHGVAKLDGNAHKIRPWLQDFSFFDMTPYGDAEVRAQIEASEDIGTSGWLLWDPNNQYHPGALKEQSPDSPQVEHSAPVAVDRRSSQ